MTRTRLTTDQQFMSYFPSPQNQWLAGLPAADRKVIEEGLVPRELTPGTVLFDQGDWLTTIWFIDRGIVSSVVPLSDGRAIQAFMVGREGLTGTEASFVPARSINRLAVQAGGTARGIATNAFQRIVAVRPAIRAALADYGWRLRVELDQTVACNVAHTADRRLAAWLLRCHDRSDGNVLSLTQEFLAQMLGTQRSTINEVAQSLQKTGAIRYSRGRIVMRDRQALEATACECYRCVMEKQGEVDAGQARGAPLPPQSDRQDTLQPPI